MGKGVVLQSRPICSVRIGHPLLQIVVLVIKILHMVVISTQLLPSTHSPHLKHLPHIKVDLLLSALNQHRAVVLQSLRGRNLVKIRLELEKTLK